MDRNRARKDRQVSKRNDPLEALLGPLEQDVMDVVWQLGDTTVGDVHEALRTRRKIAYTTVMTTMTRLAAKGLLQRDTTGKAHRYSPAVTRERYGRSAIETVMGWLVERYPEPAVSYLAEVVDDNGVSIDDLRAAVQRRREAEGS